MKTFNTTGKCIPSLHYMVDISRQVEAAAQLVRGGNYFRNKQFFPRKSKICPFSSVFHACGEDERKQQDAWWRQEAKLQVDQSPDISLNRYKNKKSPELFGSSGDFVYLCGIVNIQNIETKLQLL